MKVLLIPDKFKGSATAKEVIAAVTKGVVKAYPSAMIHSVLASDGGDGFLDAVSHYVDVEEVNVATYDPLGREMETSYLYDKNNTAYIEMAKASGMELLTPSEQDPMETSTYGTGVLIKDAIAKGAKKIYVGLGGSATNDGGIGIARAMGYVFRDGDGSAMDTVGKNLNNIQKIESNTPEAYRGVAIIAVNDVNNPLYGKNGAAHVYAKQKGATDATIETLDAGLKHLDGIVQTQLNKNVAHVQGAGAAGGTAYGLKAFFDAEFISGIEFLLELAKITELLKTETIDYIITGEGKIDGQTLSGKLIKGVVDLGKRYRIPVLGICGTLAIDRDTLIALGLMEVLEISDKSKSLEYNMENAAELIENKVYGYFKQLLS